MYRGKRALDVSLALLALLVLLAVIAIVAVVIRFRLGSPVFFRQPRPGLGGKAFSLVKFRTMLDVDESRGLTSDEDRMTPLGRLLRSTSLDELPTLWNVVRGDMSLVGPRPLLVRYLSRYTPEQARRHSVRPGLTGLAQINGRNSISWESKFALDVQYVDSASLRGDVAIISRTVSKVFRREGITADNSVTMPEFVGAPPVILSQYVRTEPLTIPDYDDAVLEEFAR